MSITYKYFLVDTVQISGNSLGTGEAATGGTLGEGEGSIILLPTQAVTILLFLLLFYAERRLLHHETSWAIEAAR